MGEAHALHVGLKPFDMTEVISPVAVLVFLKLEITDLHEDIECCSISSLFLPYCDLLPTMH